MTNHVTNKRTWQTLIAAIAAIALLAACGEMETPGGGSEGGVNDVTIVEGDQSVEVGSTVTLTANVDADEGVSEAVDWTSSNDDAATVTSSGVVNGIADGTAEITATSRVDADQFDSVTVTVGDGGDGGGGDPTPVDPGEFDHLVTSDGDSDPYWLQEWPAEDPVEGTLRYALANAEDGDVIGFADGIDEIVLHGVDVYDEGNIDSHLVIRNDVTIVGPEGGLTIRGESGYEEGDPDDGADGFTYRSRVIFVPSGVTATLQNLEITGGDFIFYGGGIRNDGDLTLQNVTVTGNRAWDQGGGVWNVGDLTILNSVISGNLAVTYDDEVNTEYSIRGGGDEGFVADLSDGGYGGGLFNEAGGSVTIENSVISGNTSKASGGAIYDRGSSVNLIDTTVENNSTTEAIADRSAADDPDYGLVNYGGGVYTMGVLSASDSTFSGNTSTSNGGGLYLDASGSATLTAPMAFTGNTAPFGGGIFHQHDGDPSNLSPSDPVSADGFTFTGNDADAPANAAYYAQDTTADPEDDGMLRMQSTQDAGPRIGAPGMPDRP